MKSDDFYIRRTFELARQGQGKTWPNPLVGCVIVKDDKIIAEGFHNKYGGPHAEIEAIQKASESVEGATLYVNLEPCCHTNKQTPPCAQRLIQEKIKKIVISNQDPNPSVCGKGIEVLRSHGIEVVEGVLAAEGEELNEVFFTVQRKKRPFIHLKLATTLDGMIALPNGESQWITGEEARQKVHELRSQHQAIMVGAETLRRDNPSLTVRLPEFDGEQPWRVVISETGDFSPTLKLFNDEHWKRTLLYCKRPSAFGEVKSIKALSLEEALKDMLSRNIVNVLLEGGARLAASFMKAKCVDRVSLFINPSFLGEGKSTLADFGLVDLAQRPVLKDIKTQWAGKDLYLTGRF